MNQVQEMWRMNSMERLDEAVQRLASLYQMMTEQPGFIRGEVVQSINEPEILIAYHAWEELADWQRFQKSQPKLDFIANRPEGLYDAVPSGMNWRLEETARNAEGALLRREVIRNDSLGLRFGAGVEGCQTHVFVDGEPETYVGCSLRMTRIAGPQNNDRGEDEGEVVVDELYESLVTIRAPGVAVS